MFKLQKIVPIIKELLRYFAFLVEEIPNILTIIVVPTFLGMFVLLPNINNWISSIITVLLMLFLFVRSFRYLNVKNLSTLWMVYLGITGFALFMFEACVILVAIENAKLNFK